MQTIGLNTKPWKRTRYTGSIRLLIFLSFLIALPCSAFSQSPHPLLEKLDSHYYYPSQLGLKKLSVKVKWLQKDLASSQLNFISHPEVSFFWDINSGIRRFQIDPRLRGLTDSRREEIESFFLNYREVILPRSLNQMLSGFKFNGIQKFPSQTIAEFQSPRSQDETQKYILNIDSKHGRISKLNIERRNPPYKVVSYFKYSKKEGKWLVSETLAQFDLGRDSYSETTSYTYRKIDGFWLPTKINQILKKGREVVHFYSFLISDFQIN